MWSRLCLPSFRARLPAAGSNPCSAVCVAPEVDPARIAWVQPSATAAHRVILTRSRLLLDQATVPRTREPSPFERFYPQPRHRGVVMSLPTPPRSVAPRTSTAARRCPRKILGYTAAVLLPPVHTVARTVAARRVAGLGARAPPSARRRGAPRKPGRKPRSVIPSRISTIGRQRVATKRTDI